MRVLIAPQEFKGSLTAAEAAEAIAGGVRLAKPGWDLDVQPMSDGGPGFLDVLQPATGGAMRSAIVAGPLGTPVRARYLPVAGAESVFIEAAEANGLALVPPEALDPLAADTVGVGELVAAALTFGPRQLVVGVGGSATTDGGTGMARALGARFRDADGAALPPGGGALHRLHAIDWDPPAGLEGVAVVVATDVRNPLLGPSGAARAFGPQKGASREEVEVLEAGLARLAEVVRRDLGVEVAGVPGGGAAGGLAAGCIAFLGAHVRSGFDCVAEAVHLQQRVLQADVVLTGEGSYDAQSDAGKVTGRLRDLAQECGRPWVVFAGRSAAGNDAHVLTIAAREPDPGRSARHAAVLLRALAREWADRR